MLGVVAHVPLHAHLALVGQIAVRAESSAVEVGVDVVGRVGLEELELCHLDGLGL